MTNIEIINENFSFLTVPVPTLDNKTIEKIEKKQKYNVFLYKITQYGLRNSIPPENLIKMAKELGRQIDIPEAELQNIGSSASKNY